MSSPSTPVIIKRRPSRAEADESTSAVLPTYPTSATSVPPVHDAAEVEEPPHRPTAAPSAAPVSQYAPVDEAEPRADGEAARPDNAGESDDFADAAEDDDDDNNNNNADGEESEQEGEEESGAPPAGGKTARPKHTRAKAKTGKSSETKRKTAEKTARAKDAKKTARKKTAAEAGGEQPVNGTAAAAVVVVGGGAALAAKKKKKRPLHRVSLLTVERVAAVPEGVNTPRSVALCESHGIATAELRPRRLEDFQGKCVNAELAMLRFTSYERRRQAHMALLLPERQREAEETAAAKAKEQQQQQQEQQQEQEEKEKQSRAMHDGDAPEGESMQPSDPLDAEALEMQRQFEEQHSRILRQERRQAAGMASGSRSRRGSSPHGARRSPSFSGTPHRSPGSTGQNYYYYGGDLPAGVHKIQSRCRVENRPPTEAERLAMDKMIDHDNYLQEVRERHYVMEENRTIGLIEQCLAKEKASVERVQNIKEGYA